MSGALFFFFWDEADWASSPAPAPSPAPTATGGGGKKRKTTKPPYIHASEDFWEARESYLLSLQPELAIEPPPSPLPVKPPQKPFAEFNPLPRYLAERPSAISAVHLAKSVIELKAAGERLTALNRAIAQAKALRLQQLAVEAAEYRARKARRAKKRLALLLAAQTLLKFLFPWRS